MKNNEYKNNIYLRISDIELTWMKTKTKAYFPNYFLQITDPNKKYIYFKTTFYNEK